MPFFSWTFSSLRLTSCLRKRSSANWAGLSSIHHTFHKLGCFDYGDSFIFGGLFVFCVGIEEASDSEGGLRPVFIEAVEVYDICYEECHIGGINFIGEGVCQTFDGLFELFFIHSSSPRWLRSALTPRL